MWRSFFFALGVSLMVLGAEALIFERFVIAPTARLPKFLNGLYEKGTADSFAQSDSGQITPFSASPQLSNGNGQDFRLPSYSQSSFGPSRFSGPQNGNYGGGRVDLSRSGLNPQTNRTAGPTAYPVSFGNNPAIANNGQAQPIQPSFSHDSHKGLDALEPTGSRCNHFSLYFFVPSSPRIKCTKRSPKFCLGSCRGEPVGSSAVKTGVGTVNQIAFNRL